MCYLIQAPDSYSRLSRYGRVLTSHVSKQPLSLLLKLSPLIDELALYDVVNTPGVAADLSHISSKAVSNSPLRLSEATNTELSTSLTFICAPTESCRLPSRRWWCQDCLQGCRPHCHPRWRSPYVNRTHLVQLKLPPATMLTYGPQQASPE